MWLMSKERDTLVKTDDIDHIAIYTTSSLSYLVRAYYRGEDPRPVDLGVYDSKEEAEAALNAIGKAFKHFANNVFYIPVKGKEEDADSILFPFVDPDRFNCDFIKPI